MRPLRPSLLVLLGLAFPSLTAIAEEPPIFVDRAAESGVDFVYFNGMSGELYFAEYVGGGAALFDYDRDGDLDLYATQGEMLGPGRTLEDAIYPPHHPPPFSGRLYRNDLELVDGRPRARFVDVTDRSGALGDGYGMGVAQGDYDGDGWPDLYVTNFGANELLRNNGDGTFADVTEASGTGDRLWGVSAAFADLDRDGWLDLFVGNYVDYRIATHKPCATQTGAADYCGPLAYEPEPDVFYRNRGDGTFEDVTSSALLDVGPGNGLGVIVADFDADGWLDVYVANDQMANFLWMNGGDGTWSDNALLAGCAVNAAGRPEASMGVVAGDFDGDGDEDLFMSHLTRETNTLYLNDGGGFFDDATQRSGLGMASYAWTGFGTALLDYDSDGLLDLFVANGAVRRIEEQARAGDPYPLRQRNQLFRNLGGGRFEEVEPAGRPFLEVSEVSRGVAAGDVDNDGDPDLVVVNSAAPLELLINELPEPHWTGADARIARDGRAALGARAELRRPGVPTLARRVRTDGSYAAAGDPRVLFGLGDGDGRGDGAAELRVEWLGGGRSLWRDVRPGRYYVLAPRGGGGG